MSQNLLSSISKLIYQSTSLISIRTEFISFSLAIVKKLLNFLLLFIELAEKYKALTFSGVLICNNFCSSIKLNSSSIVSNNKSFTTIKSSSILLISFVTSVINQVLKISFLSQLAK
jgi:hypothetical protein